MPCGGTAGPGPGSGTGQVAADKSFTGASSFPVLRPDAVTPTQTHAQAGFVLPVVSPRLLRAAR